jgi:hypothetical protein
LRSLSRTAGRPQWVDNSEDVGGILAVIYFPEIELRFA